MKLLLQVEQQLPKLLLNHLLISVAFMGGAGNMLALVIAIFIVSKRDDYKVIGKLGFVPALFNISEPLMFGLPVVMNPILYHSNDFNNSCLV